MKVFHFLSAKKLSKFLKEIVFLEEYLKKEVFSFFKYSSRKPIPFKIFESFLALKKWKTFI
jgi:hypothetical protein